MTIHHDKTIYGKVYSGSETISEDALDSFLKELNDDESLFAAEQTKQAEPFEEDKHVEKSLVKKGDADDIVDRKKQSTPLI